MKNQFDEGRKTTHHQTYHQQEKKRGTERRKKTTQHNQRYRNTERKKTSTYKQGATHISYTSTRILMGNKKTHITSHNSQLQHIRKQHIIYVQSSKPTSSTDADNDTQGQMKGQR